jgi:hypothetical protein
MRDLWNGVPGTQLFERSTTMHSERIASHTISEWSITHADVRGSIQAFHWDSPSPGPAEFVCAGAHDIKLAVSEYSDHVPVFDRSALIS